MSEAGLNNRYSRQILFAPIGGEGQKKILSSRVAIVGCGALGTVSAEMLVRAGTGLVRIVDRDFVEFSNLQRQSLFTEADASGSVPKAVAAQRALTAINSSVMIEGLVCDLTHRNIEEVCSDVDLILDGTDNFETRYLVNDFAVKMAIPWVYGAALGSYGIGLAIQSPETACLRCIFPEPPPAGSTETCDTAGILAPVIHVVSAFQVSQALRLIAEGSFTRSMLHFDVWRDEWRIVEVGSAERTCLCCQSRNFEYLRGEQGQSLTRLCGRNAVQVRPVEGRFDFEEAARRLSTLGLVTSNEHLLRMKLGNVELVLFRDGRALIKGTDDLSVARALYARYVGS